MKKILLLILLFSSSAFANKKILMMIPNDFMWPEYALPLQLYKNQGFEVLTAGRFKDAVNPDRRNVEKGNKLYFPEAKPLKTDLTFNDVKVDEFDAVTFVAGNGAWHDFFPSDVVHKIVIETVEKNKILGLLCASTGLLGISGNYDGKQKSFAEGKNVVGYYRVEGIIRMGKANYISGGQNEPGVAVDGNIVTGRNPESSTIFGEKIVDVLLNKSPNSKKK